MPTIGTIEVSPEHFELLQHNLRLILKINENLNLTRISCFESGMLLHIEDSLTALPEFLNAPAGNYADLGTGGGFPGIPLAIVSGRSCLLVDSVKKKIRALEQVVEELGLTQVTGFDGRIEELALQYPKHFSVLTARALSSFPSLMELAAPLLCHKGQLICYKAQVSPEEDEQIRYLEPILGLQRVSQRDLVLSDGETQRCIVVFEKIGTPALKLPRRVGLAQKQPLTNQMKKHR